MTLHKHHHYVCKNHSNKNFFEIKKLFGLRFKPEILFIQTNCIGSILYKVEKKLGGKSQLNKGKGSIELKTT